MLYFFLFCYLKEQLESDIQSKRNFVLEEEKNSEYVEGMTPTLQKPELCLLKHESFSVYSAVPQSLRHSILIRDNIPKNNQGTKC